MKVKKIVSMLLSLTMLMSIIPSALTGGIAVQADPATNKGKIIFEYMTFKDGITSVTPNNGDLLVKTDSIPNNLQAGDTFFVGIKMVDFDKINARMTKKGMYSMSVGLSYDKRYVEPTQTTSNGMLRQVKQLFGGPATSWAEDLGGNMYIYSPSIDSASGNYNNYDITNCGMTVTGDTGSIITTLKYSSGTETPVYEGQFESYIAIYPFRVVSNPGASGAKSIWATKARNSDTSTFGKGTVAASERQEFEYNAISDAAKWEQYVEWDDMAVNLFPQTRTITYKVDTMTGASYDATSISDLTKTARENVKLKDFAAVAANLPDASKITVPTGYVLKEWVLDDDGDGVYNDANDTTVFDSSMNDSLYVGTADRTIFAHYVEGYNVTFDANGGHFGTDETKTITDISVATGDTFSSANKPADPTFDGYTFKGWSTAGNDASAIQTDAQLDAISAATTLYAIWEPVAPQTNPDKKPKWTITFNTTGVAGETVAPTNTVNVNNGDKIPQGWFPTPTKTGYELVEWNTEKNGSGVKVDANLVINEANVGGTVSADGETATLDVYPIWNSTAADAFTLTFEAGDHMDSNAQVPAPRKIANGKSFVDEFGTGALPVAQAAQGYGFDKWVVKGTSTEFTENDKLTADTTVTATYKQQITITFDMNNGTHNGSGDPVKVEMAPGKIDFANVPQGVTRTDRRFLGWKTMEGTAFVDFVNDPDNTDTTGDEFTTDTTVYAIWGQAIDITSSAAAPEYDGTQKGIQASELTFTEPGTATPVNPAPVAADYKVTYMPQNADDSGNVTGATATENVTDAANYVVTVTFNPKANSIADLYYQANAPIEYEIQPKSLYLVKDASDPRAQSPVVKDPPSPLEIKYIITDTQGGTSLYAGVTKDGTGANGYKIEYYDFNDNGTANKIENGEYTLRTDVPSAKNKYIVRFVFNDNTVGGGNKNYVFAGSALDAYDVDTTDNAVKALFDGVGNNVKFQITGARVKVTFKSAYKTFTGETFEYELDSGASIDGTTHPYTTDPTKDITNPASPTDAPTLPTLTTKPDDYMFDGWYIDKTGDGYTADDTDKIDETTEITEDITVAAKWVLSTNTGIPTDPTSGDVQLTLTANKKNDTNVADYDVVANLKTDDTFATAATFDPTAATQNYYARVTNEYDQLKVNVVTAEEHSNISVYDNADCTGTPIATKTFTASDITLLSTLDTDAVVTLNAAVNRSMNTIAIKIVPPADIVAGNEDHAKVYTFNIMRENAGMTLAYGNSPYGEIMKMEETTDQVTLDSGTTTNKWSDAFKAEAKKKFAENNLYDTAYMPTSVVDSTGADLNTSAKSRYTVQAWTDVASITAPTPEEAEKIADPEINMDRNDYALFVFNGTPFVDPGVTVLDEFGMPITTVERSISFTRMGGASGDGVEDAVQVADSITATGASTNYLIDGLTNVGPRDDGSVIRTRPGIYTMTYKATTTEGKELTATRKVVVLQPLGDTNFSNTINDNDTNTIVTATNELDTLYQGTDPAVKRLIVYKVFDTNFTDSVNDNDANSILEAYNDGRMVENQYIELPETN